MLVTSVRCDLLMFRAGIIILLSLFLASCLGKAKHYRQYSDKGLSLAEAKSYCNSEGNVDRIAARDASAAAREAQRNSGPRNYDITGVRIDNQVHGTIRERPQASGGFATGALNSLNDNLQGMFAKRKAVRRCMMSLGYVETEAPASYSTIPSQTVRQAGEIRDQMGRERIALGESRYDLCKTALTRGSDERLKWSSKPNDQEFVIEAGRRGLSIVDCRKALGL